MISGFSQNFDLQDVPIEIIDSIRKNIKKWDIALQKQNEEIIKKRREEVKRLEAEYKNLINYEQLRKIPKPKYYKWVYCPCANGGEGGFFIDELNE